jgi:salicylate hydroxylase
VPPADFAVAGAGVGGLAAALALARLGRRVVVVEREAGPHELGNGLQLAPNATRVLAHLGLAMPLPRYARPEALELRDAANGRPLAEIALGATVRARHGAPYCTVARADLTCDLAHAAADAGAAIRYGAGLMELHPSPAGILVRLADGESIEARGLIGADGLWSPVRDQVAPGARRHHVGDIAWRATVPMSAVAGELPADRIVAWLGPRIHAVHYPIEAGARLNLVVVTEGDWTGQGWHQATDAAELAALAGGLARPLAAAIAAGEAWRRWPLFVTRPEIAGGAGPVTLLGDAAHPVLPYLAQGAGMAIEDAFALAEAVAAVPGDPAAACRRYERTRGVRLGQGAAATRRNGRIFHLAGPARLARDLVLAALPPALLLARYDWLWGGGPIPARAVR